MPVVNNTVPYASKFVKRVDIILHVSYQAQTVKSLPSKQKTQVWEDTLEKGMTTHSSNLSWRIPWTEEPGGLQSMESQKSWT